MFNLKEFKTIPKWQGYYKINENGQVLSLNYRRTNKPCLIKPNKNKIGYIYYNLNKKGIGYKFLAHRLVALTFLNNDDPINKTQINHKDGNKENNHISNLEWCTPSENRIHGIKSGLITFKHGQAHRSAILTDKQHQYIKELYNKGYNKTQLVDIFNVSMATINKYLNKV